MKKVKIKKLKIDESKQKTLKAQLNKQNKCEDGNLQAKVYVPDIDLTNKEKKVLCQFGCP